MRWSNGCSVWPANDNTAPNDVRFQGQPGRHVLKLTSSQFDPKRTFGPYLPSSAKVLLAHLYHGPGSPGLVRAEPSDCAAVHVPEHEGRVVKFIIEIYSTASDGSKKNSSSPDNGFSDQSPWCPQGSAFRACRVEETRG